MSNVWNSTYSFLIENGYYSSNTKNSVIITVKDKNENHFFCMFGCNVDEEVYVAVTDDLRRGDINPYIISSINQVNEINNLLLLNKHTCKKTDTIIKKIVLCKNNQNSR